MTSRRPVINTNTCNCTPLLYHIYTIRVPQIHLYYKSTLFGPTGSVYTGSDCWQNATLYNNDINTFFFFFLG